MGPALRHATRRLAAADSHVKLMILLTDGKPYDSDTYQDNAYAQEDTKMALREARRRDELSRASLERSLARILDLKRSLART